MAVIPAIKMIDSHCHPQFPQYDEDREEMIKRALDGGVRMICVGTDLEMSKKAIELAAEYEGIWATVGLHPNDNLNEGFDEGEYEELLKQDKVVAMGEIGLDYYRTAEPEDQKFQKDRFVKQLELADKMSKPIILHCRDATPKFPGENLSGQAHADMIQILETRSQKLETNRGVIHSFTGTWQQAQQYFDLGFYIGLNGIITFTDPYNETVINTPLDRILLETDAPYLAPVPYRGKRNEPAYIIEVAKKIAELKGVSVKEVTEQTTKNTQKLFSINAQV